MKAYVKGFFVGSILLTVIFGVGFYLDSRGYFALKEMNLSYLNQESISTSKVFNSWKEQLEQEVRALQGTSLFKLPLRDLQNSLLNNKWIKEVELKRRFPSKLQVKIHTKKWIANVLKSGKLFPLSEECQLFPQMDMVEAADLIVLNSKDFNNEKNRVLACEFLNALGEGFYFINENISEIKFKENKLLVYLRNPELTVEIGTQQIPIQVARVEKVLEYLDLKGLSARVISSDFTKKVVVRLRKDR